MIYSLELELQTVVICPIGSRKEQPVLITAEGLLQPLLLIFKGATEYLSSW